MKNTIICSAIMLAVFPACSVLADWTTPVPVSEINTDYYEEWGPFLSYDGLSLYFSRLHGLSPVSLGKIYEARRAAPTGPFTEIREILSSSNEHISCPWVSPDGLRMYYMAHLNGARLMFTRRNHVSDPWPLGTPINELNILGLYVNSPKLTPDELTIVFCVRPSESSKYDIYTASRSNRNAPFTNIAPITELNSSLNDTEPSISPDGLTMVFASDRGHQNNYSLYIATRDSTTEPFGNIEHLSLFDAPVNGSKHPYLSADETALYYLRDLGNSNRDIYVSYLVIQEVAVDIRPASCPNPLNLKSKGVLPVAVLGTQDFDVNIIDIASIRLAGVVPVRSSFEDVASPVTDNADCNCSDEGPDGFIDLVLKFDTQQLANVFFEENGELHKHDVVTVYLTGVLLDDTPIKGKDCVVIVGNASKQYTARELDINIDGVVDLFDLALLGQFWLEPAVAP